jgi:thioredoxin 1
MVYVVDKMKRGCMKMTKNFVAFVLLLFLSVSVISNSGCTQPTNTQSDTSNVNAKAVVGEEDVPEYDNYADLLKEHVRLDGKLIMMELGSDSCIPCKQMEPIIEDLQENYSNYFHTVFVNTYEDPDTARELGIQFIPTQVFFDSKGIEKYRHTGFFSKEEILSVLKMNGCELPE